MIRVSSWLLYSIALYWWFIDEPNLLRKFGLVSGGALLASMFIFSVRVYSYPRYVKINKTNKIFDFISVALSFLYPLLIITGWDHFDRVSLFFSMLGACIFLFDREGVWFWDHRWGDLKFMPDSGCLNDSDYRRIKSLSLGALLLPVPLFFLASLMRGG